eukprot:244693-Pleurochrysis_carterae.AAC.1
MLGKRRCGASATPGFAVRMSAATPRRATHSRCALPPRAIGATSCAPACHPRATPVLPRDT